MNVEETAALLGSTRLFAGLAPEAAASLASEARQRIYPQGHFIFQEGEPGDTLFVVLSGSVQVYRASAEGKDVLLATLRPPDVFGELCVLDEERRSATAQALETTRVLALGRRSVLDLLARDPEATDAVLRSVGSLVRRVTDEAGDLAFLDLPSRAAGVVVRMVEEDGIVPLDFRAIQAGIASAIGCSRRNAGRIVGLFLQWGHLELDGRSIVVRDLDALRSRAASV